MKYGWITLNILLLIAVIILFILHFSGQKDEAGEKAVTVPVLVHGTGAGVVYVDIDTLQNNFEFYKTSKEKLEKMQANAESSLDKRSTEFQNRIREYQDKGMSMTMEQRMAEEEKLKAEEEKFLQYRDQLRENILDEEMKLQDELLNRIRNYLVEYNKSRNYQYILAYSRVGSNLLYASDSLDITRDVLKGLNEPETGKK